MIEYSHRATPAVVTILVVATAFPALRRHRKRRDIVVPALAAAPLVPLQAFLGAISVWLELPPWGGRRCAEPARDRRRARCPQLSPERVGGSAVGLVRAGRVLRKRVAGGGEGTGT